MLDIRWHAMLVLEKLLIKLRRHNNTEKHALQVWTLLSSRPHVLTWIHPFVWALTYRRFWHRFCAAWHQFHNFPDRFSPRAEPHCLSSHTRTHKHLCMYTYTHQKAYLHHRLWNSGSPGLLLSVQSHDCVWERESLCDIRAWDRKSCREFARINGH